MVRPKKILTPEVRGNERFFYTNFFFIFHFNHFFEKWSQRHLVTQHWIEHFWYGTYQYMFQVSKIGSKSVEEFVSRFFFVQISSEAKGHCFKPKKYHTPSDFFLTFFFQSNQYLVLIANWALLQCSHYLVLRQTFWFFW